MWHLIFTKPQKEMFAEARLNEQGFTTYLPQLRVEKIVRQQRKIMTQPYFPRYMFILHDRHFEKQQHVIKNTPGISAIQKIGEHLISVGEDIITSLQDILGELNNSYQSAFKPGEVVEILEGPFKNHTAIFLADDANDRAVLLIQFIMQTETKISVKKTSIKKF